MDTDLIAYYRGLRAPKFSPYNSKQMFVYGAKNALNGARSAMQDAAVRRKWEAMGGECVPEYEACNAAPEAGSGHVRIVERPEYAAYDLYDLTGEMFDPAVNTDTDIKPEILEREKETFLDRVRRDGIWAYVAEYWDGTAWEHADGIGGIVGDEFSESGYAEDLMRSAMDKLAETHARQARDMEAARPDMYGPLA